nr:MAG TPA: hypothetical protein [Caudoviricetes sp.]
MYFQVLLVCLVKMARYTYLNTMSLLDILLEL